MSTCSDPSTLYCLPSANDTLSENQSYTLEYNPKFGSITNMGSVDVWLYHSNGSLFTSTLSVPNNGAMTFTIDDVYAQGVTR